MIEVARKRWLLAGLLLAVFVGIWLLSGDSDTESSVGRQALEDVLVGGGEELNSHRRPDPPARSIVERAPLFGRAPSLSRESTPDAGSSRDKEERACANGCGIECIADGGKLVCPSVCETRADCAMGELCVSTVLPGDVQGPSRCLASNCSPGGGSGTDDCGPGRTCVFDGDLDAPVFHCARTGERSLGEPCMTGNQQSAENTLCGAGLSCQNSKCLPSSCATDDECPMGSKCMDMGGTGHRSCAPMCFNDDQCPPGLRCADWSDSPYASGSQCVSEDVPPNCLETGCTDPEEECVMLFAATWGPVAKCWRECSSDLGSCAAGEFCFAGHCREDCGEHPCDEGSDCVPVPGDGTRRLCRIDLDAKISAFFDGL